MYICVDFDGTCVEHDFPHVGKEIGAAPVLRYLAKDHNLILYTMRGDSDTCGDKKYTFLSDAIDWFRQHDIPLYGINENPRAKFSDSPKVHADIYIDDRSLGIPLDHNKNVDWVECAKLLQRMGLIDGIDIDNLIKQIIHEKNNRQ